MPYMVFKNPKNMTQTYYEGYGTQAAAVSLVCLPAELQELRYELSANVRLSYRHLWQRNAPFVFKLTITPARGKYMNQTYVFSITIPYDYPNSPPTLAIEEASKVHNCTPFEALVKKILKYTFFQSRFVSKWDPELQVKIQAIRYGEGSSGQCQEPSSPHPNGWTSAMRLSNIVSSVIAVLGGPSQVNV
ncbi:hypothetical protein EIP91_007198 [Steccherinum ochraceum]|uniref:UBC core domain-containing protein n=1 Tax=Steccherinum ochraceum TaxID=92696 RepID=A0A4R0RCU9_9APHY|nr:hypothetical protein EIP91_007198 [Steccherinum ochraceum]